MKSTGKPPTGTDFPVTTGLEQILGATGCEQIFPIQYAIGFEIH